LKKKHGLLLLLIAISVFITACSGKDVLSNTSSSEITSVPTLLADAKTSTPEIGIATATPEMKEQVIENTSEWDHPTKAVFEKYSYIIDKVELLNGGVYPVFHIGIEGHAPIHKDINDIDFIKELSQANGFWSFEIITREDQINQPYERSFSVNKLKVACNSDSKTVERFFEITKGSDGQGDSIYEKIFSQESSNIDKDNFEFTYNGFKINKDTTIDEVIKNIGTGTADESNNYGYIGVSRDMHYSRMAYPKDSPVFDIITAGVSQYPDTIEYLDITDAGTKMVKKGDSVDKLFECYGQPDLTAKKEDKVVSCKYLSGRSISEYLEFDITESGEIERIILHY